MQKVFMFGFLLNIYFQFICLQIKIDDLWGVKNNNNKKMIANHTELTISMIAQAWSWQYDAVGGCVTSTVTGKIVKVERYKEG